jgi:hypothetical protein
LVAVSNPFGSKETPERCRSYSDGGDGAEFSRECKKLQEAVEKKSLNAFAEEKNMNVEGRGKSESAAG